MTLEDMIEGIESTSKDNMWKLVEACTNPVERFQLRDLFFRALKELALHYDMPNGEWES
jgi:hypothetical protein